MDADLYWQKFIEKTGRSGDIKYSGAFRFEAKGITEAELLVLVVSGKKTADTSAYSSYCIDNEPLPISGEIYIVEDCNEKPYCIVEVTDVTVLPYRDITWDMARKEGEDENIEAWREKYDEYFKYDSEIMGYEFTPDMNVVFEQFRVIYR